MTDRSAAVVTPEGVALDLPLAGVGSRAVAYLIDLAILGIVLLVVLLGLSGVDGSGALPDWIAVSVLLLAVATVQFGYPIGFETFWRGRTPGKAALGLRVVTVEGGPVGFRHAAVRAALGLVDFLLTAGSAAVITALATTRSQRLGDLVAGTVVVRERVAGPPAEARRFTPPPGLEGFAAALDVSRLDATRYGTVRTFLLRAGSLDAGVRARLATDLALRIRADVRPEPPGGLPPEAYLWCVAAAYQRRSASWGRPPQVQAGPTGGVEPPGPGPSAAPGPTPWAPESPPGTGGFRPPS